MQPAPDPTPVAQPAAPTIDISGLVNGIVQGFQTVLTGWASSIPQTAAVGAETQGQTLLDQMWRSPYNVLTRIPPELTTAQPDVLSLQEAFRGVQFGLMALLIVVAGYRMIFGRESMTETAIQFGISIVASAALVWWSGQAIGMANLLSDSIGWPRAFKVPLGDLASNLALGLLFLFMLFFALKAWFKGAAVVLLVDVLLVTGPLALLLWMVPQTSKWGAWWVDQFVAAVVSRPATAIVFRIGVGVVFAVSDPYLALVLGAAAFWLATELPDKLASNVSVSSGIASMARLAVLQRAAGMAGGAISGVASTAGGALAGRVAAGSW